MGNPRPNDDLSPLAGPLPTTGTERRAPQSDSNTAKPASAGDRQEISMSTADLDALLPLLIMSATAVVVMLAIAIRRNHLVAATIALVGVAASFCSLLLESSAIPRE